MSHATMYPIKPDGEVDLKNSVDYQNAWLGAMMVWTDIGKAHGREVGFRMEQMQKVWDLARDESVPEHERIVMAMTFDKVYVATENFQRVIDAIEKCRPLLPAHCHVFAWAKQLKDWSTNPDVRGACWQATSCGDAQWIIYNRETDESRPVNIDVDDNCANELFENTPVAELAKD